MAAPYPLLLEPILKEKLWGGRTLERVVDKSLPPGARIGESWDTWEGCRVLNGVQRGATLGELISADPLGTGGAAGVQLPLLFKYLDARQALSVQVHPDDAQAQALEGEPRGKTEAWYILHAEPGATIVHGFARPVDERAVREALAAQRLPDLLAFVPARAGDVFFVPAGLVHAIGAGIVLAEIQQNSDTTYRFYDWDRRDDGGNPRELHVEKSLRVAEFGARETHRVAPLTLRSDALERTFLVACRYFALEHWRARRVGILPRAGGFRIVSALAGGARLSGEGEALDLAAGQTAFLPAALEACRVAPAASGCELLCAYVPDLRRDIIAPLRQAGRADAAIAELGGPDLRYNDLPPLMA